MGTKRSIRVWDIPTRLFHWLLVFSVAGLWYTGTEGDMDRHIILGYTVLGLLLFRLGWGVWGGELSRFQAFRLSPKAAATYLRNGLHSDAPGHNPLGSWGVVLILLFLGIQVTTGLFANDSILTEGPMARFVSSDTSDWLTTIHSLNFNILLGILALHIAAVLFHTVIKREDIIHGMITGRRAIDSRYPEPGQGSWKRLALTTLPVVMLMIWLVNFA